MKSFSPGLSDSIASVIADPPQCPHCDSSSQIVDGLCVGCLLQAGLDPDDECAPEMLVSALAEITLPDKNWRLGNYEILEEIGRGGMGVIYRARQRHSRRIVAVKRVLGYHADSRETLARFRREAQAAASLDHPNILPIYEVSESEDGLPFFSMKFAPGGSLQEVGPALRNEPRQCVALVAKVTRAVQHAHSKGILHRDLKPGNILLDGSGEPLVSDFGLAKWLDTTSDLTRTLTIFGTPGYIAPEQASGPAAQLKPAADIYSLGAILFDLLAGRPPFLGSHALSVIRQAAESPAPKLRSLAKIADRDLETICARCLEREPSARYHSAHDLAEDLERWLEGRPIVARPVSFPVKIWRWSRRNPTLAVSLAGILILGAVGLAATIASSRLSSIVEKAKIAQHSIVVLPFEDLDEVSANSNAAQSATHEFTSVLKAEKGIQVNPVTKRSANSIDLWRAEDWKTIGAAAGARMVLSGTVRHREGRHRVALRLIETATGSVVGSWLQDLELYLPLSNKPLADILSFLRDPAIAHAPEIGGTSSPLAKSYYERGKEFFLRYNLPDQERAIDSLREAVRIDPGYGQAFALLATTCQLRSIFGPAAPWLDEADAAASAALRIAPMLPEAHQARAGNLLYRGHVKASLEEHLAAYELDPGNGRSAAKLGDVYHQLGRSDLAVLWFERATRRETRPVYADNLGDVWTDLGDLERAEQAFKTASIFRPDLPVGVLGQARVAMFRGDYQRARSICQDAIAKYTGNPQPLMMAAQIEFFDRRFEAAEARYRDAIALSRIGGVSYYGAVRFLSAQGFLSRILGNDSEGKNLLEEANRLDEEDLVAAPDNAWSLYSHAANKAALDDREAAIVILDRSRRAGWSDFHSLMLDPRFDTIRNDPRFVTTLESLKDQAERFRLSYLQNNNSH